MVTRFNKKICLLGDEGVGKTSLIRKFVFNSFDDSYIHTIGTKISKKEMLVQGKDGKPIQLFMMIWDIVGHKSAKKVPTTYYAGVEGIMVVFDATRPETFKDLEFWVNSLVTEKNFQPVVIILGNKSDLKDQVKVSEEELKAIGEKFKAGAFFTSARTGENVEAAFARLGKDLVNKSTGAGWSWM